METLWKDIRFSVRALWRAPGFTAVALFALVLGIGANTAVFSVVNAVFLKQLPFRDPDRLAVVWEQSPRTHKPNVANPQNVADWQARNHSFERIAAFIDSNLNITGDGAGPEQLDGAFVTRDFFPVLGVAPMIGRNFTAAEDVPDPNDTVILSYALWQRRYGGDRAIVGKKIRMGDHSGTIVGVMPAGFRFPGSKAEMWDLVPLRPGAKRTGRFLTPIGRLKPGVTFSQAQADMDVIARQLAAEDPQFDTGWGITVVPMREQFVGELRAPLLVLLGAVGMVLLIACANVANLMLMRSSVRQREMAIRTSLGASRGRIIRQVLTESGILGVLAGGMGLLAAIWVKDGLLAMLPDDMSVAKVNSVTIDARVLTFAFVVALATALLFGLMPALRASRPDLGETLKESGRGVYGSLRKNRLRAILVSAEMAIALTLLIGAGLLMKSFVHLENVPPGFDPEHVLTMRMILESSRYANNKQAVGGLSDMLARIQRLPGVRAAGAIHFLPLTGLDSATGFRVDGEPVPSPGSEPVTAVSIVTPGYFPAMGISLKKGRLLSDSDVDGRPLVTVVNETLAKQFFPNTGAVGRRLFVQWGRSTPYEIVGVVADVKHDGLDKTPAPALYFSYGQEPIRIANVVIRTAASPMSIARAAQDQIHAVDKDQAIGEIKTMDAVFSKSLSRPRFQSVLLGTFAGLALLLAAIGIFGVISYSVAQRTHEIGIRMALGAERKQVLQLVVTQAFVLALLGAAGGLAGAFALTRYLRTLLFDVSATDAATFVALPILLCAIAVAASYIPARRAARVDPLAALRYE
jgi:putative ABC transport system permease protein